jgi:hypothetical protein
MIVLEARVRVEAGEDRLKLEVDLRRSWGATLEFAGAEDFRRPAVTGTGLPSEVNLAERSARSRTNITIGLPFQQTTTVRSSANGSVWISIMEPLGTVAAR